MEIENLDLIWKSMPSSLPFFGKRGSIDTVLDHPTAILNLERNFLFAKCL